MGLYSKFSQNKLFDFWHSILCGVGFYTSLAIDVDSLSRINVGSETKPPVFWMRFYKKHNILFYRGTPPIVLKKGWGKKPNIVNVSEMTDEQKDMVIDLLKTN